MISQAADAAAAAKKAAEEKAAALQKAAEEKANALQQSNAFSQLESMMAATPGQLVAEAREKAGDVSINPLGSLDDFGLTTQRPRQGFERG